MILGEALQSATQTLLRKGIDDASAEAEILLGHVLGMSKTQLYTEPEKVLTSTEISQLWSLIQRRLNHEPTAYILGHCEFYGIDLVLDCHTFIPRPETELLVEQAVELAQRIFRPGKGITIADIGTGCGAIAVCLALALPQAEIYATDVSAPALHVAEMNCRRHAVNRQVKLLQGNSLEPLSQPVDMIVANLPYIKDCEIADLDAEIIDFEPTAALAGGLEGLDIMQKVLEQMPGKLNYGGCFLLEIGQGQGRQATSLINNHFQQASIELISDLSGIERVVKVEL